MLKNVKNENFIWIPMMQSCNINTNDINKITKKENIMEKSFNEQSYALVEKLAYKFAYGNDNYLYEEYINAGIEGLLKAINTYKEGTKAAFPTYANTCIRNAMCTRKTEMEKLGLVQDDNVQLEEIDSLITEQVEDNMETTIKQLILSFNNNNQRNADMVAMHIGLNGQEPMDYKELSAHFNVSAERVRQVYKSTISAIKKNKQATELLYSFVG